MKHLTSLQSQSYGAGLTPSPSYTGGMSSRADLGIMRKGSQAVTYERCTAVLAASALENTMNLAALATAAYEIAPCAENEYRDIIRAYANSAIRHINNF